MYTVYGERISKYPPMSDIKTGEVFDDGIPKKTILATWQDKAVADKFAKNVKANVSRNLWKIWVE